MKTVLSILFSLTLTAVIAQDDCSTYFLFSEGATFEYKYYDKKDRLEATSTHTIKEVDTDNGVVTAQVNTSMADDKGKETVNGDYTVTCDDGTFKMDLSRMIPEESMAALNGGEAEMEISGDGFRLPNDLSVGEELPDSENTISIDAGVMDMKMTIELREQKVEAKETVTTPAGTFECIRFSYTTYTKMAFVKNESRTVNWYAEDVGTVKSESYDKRGKLATKMVLTSYTKS